MNLERVQKYYELIDKELGLESDEDLFGFESDEDLFGFESDEDLFGFESDEDLFGFESDDEDLFGTEGLKDVFGKAKSGVASAFNKVKTGAKPALKKSFAFVMNILRTIVSAITTWWKNKKITKLVKLLKKISSTKDAAEKEKIMQLIKSGKNDSLVLISTVVKHCSSAEDVKKYQNVLKTVQSASINDKDFMSKMKVISNFSELSNYISKSSTSLAGRGIDMLKNLFASPKIELDNESCDRIGVSLKAIMKSIAIYSRKLTQFYQRKGETWFMQEADKNVLESIKNVQTIARTLISSTNVLLGNSVKGKETKEEPNGESIMADIKEMMAANESLNDIIFDMEMDI